jgi:hypothetical protein
VAAGYRSVCLHRDPQGRGLPPGRPLDGLLHYLAAVAVSASLRCDRTNVAGDSSRRGA